MSSGVAGRFARDGFGSDLFGHETRDIVISRRSVRQLPSTLGLGDRRGQRIGLMGGSFNPAHEGHRMIAELALKRLRLHRVWWLVSPQNPLKPSTEMAPMRARVAQALALRKDPRIEVTTLEADLGTRYTADTLAALRKRFPHTRFVWIMGADNLAQMPAWRDWSYILRTVLVAVFDRPTYSLKALSGKTARRFARSRVPERRGSVLTRRRPPAWIFHHTLLNPVSATQMRKRKKAI
ncbi:MAG: nicotinate-nucleotide adenylyltransferase [Alphaproteobacteria bacterium]|nr:nicotinate-nucleotide adenylyltransferase [Alphaproteobacteria bacterium]